MRKKSENVSYRAALGYVNNAVSAAHEFVQVDNKLVVSVSGGGDGKVRRHPTVQPAEVGKVFLAQIAKPFTAGLSEDLLEAFPPGPIFFHESLFVHTKKILAKCVNKVQIIE
jgi:hypothetical protein